MVQQTKPPPGRRLCRQSPPTEPRCGRGPFRALCWRAGGRRTGATENKPPDRLRERTEKLKPETGWRDWRRVFGLSSAFLRIFRALYRQRIPYVRFDAGSGAADGLPEFNW